jgi:hypothetical protein
VQLRRDLSHGCADGTDLSGLPVALASCYSDDEPGSPWTWTLYLDASASNEQRAALESIYATASASGSAIAMKATKRSPA